MSRPEFIEVTTDGPARAVFTTRRGGVSAGGHAALNLGATTGDDSAAVRANRLALCGALGLDADRVTMGHQVHGAEVRMIEAPTRPGRFAGGLVGWPEGDGLATARPGLGLVVLGADCLPVLLWRRDRPAVAAAHAGWRGLVGGVIAAAVARLDLADRVGAAIGPGIGADAYVVGPEVRDRFAATFGEETVRGRAVDLAGAARIALRRAGIPDSAITSVGGCTSSEPERFFSFRRDGAACGRQAGVVWGVAE